MRKRQRREPPKIPAEPPAPAPSPGEEAAREFYSLEDIMNEFGGWSRPGAEQAPEQSPEPEQPPQQPARPEAPPKALPPEPEPDRPAQPPQQPEAPEAPEEPEAPAQPQEPAAPPPPAKQQPRFQFIQMDFDEDGRSQSTPLNELPPEEPPQQPQAQPAAPQARQEPAPAPQKAESRNAPRKREPKDVHRALCKQFKGLRVRMRLSLVWSVLAVALTVVCHWQIPLGGFVFPAVPTGRLLIGLIFAGILTAWDVLFNGVYRLLQLRPGLDTLVTFCAAVFTVDGVVNLSGSARLPYAAVLLPALSFAMWGRVLQNRAQRKSLRVVINLPENPMAVVRSERAWGSRDCLFRAKGDPDTIVDDLNVPSVVDKAMAIYAPCAIGLSLALALVMYFFRDRGFLLSWALLLAASVPMAAFVTWWRPFASLAVRLSSTKAGAALCGWRGVHELYSPCCLAATDSDLFPNGNIKLNGIKVFGGRSMAQLSGYVYAVVAQSGSGLTPVFKEVYLNQNGMPCKTDSFRRYEGGGLGANIQGDRVLVGSIAFMRAMRVRMEEGTNLRQAVYCAVNNELAAVFALKYVPSPMVRAGLDTAVHAKHLTLLLSTRDFILTPDVIHRKYKIPSAVMEFPSTEERARLSGPYAALSGSQAALLGRDSFYLLAETVAGAQSLCGGVRAGLAVNLLGGAIGLLLAAVLLWTGSLANASSAHLMLYCLLWTFPSLVLSVVSGK